MMVEAGGIPPALQLPVELDAIIMILSPHPTILVEMRTIVGASLSKLIKDLNSMMSVSQMSTVM